MATRQQEILRQAAERNDAAGLQRIAGLIDAFIDGGAVKPPNAEYVHGEIARLDHADNGNGSTLHPLTAFHFSTGDNDHWTLQSGWLQTLCLRQMGIINDNGLQIMTAAAVTATKKAEVKAAQDTAFHGKGIQSIDNIHFYLQNGGVATCTVTFTSVRTLVTSALRKLGTIGTEIISKDDEFLADKDHLENYRLKAQEAPAWDRLRPLLQAVATSDRPFIRREDAIRKATAHEIFDALVRARGGAQ